MPLRTGAGVGIGGVFFLLARVVCRLLSFVVLHTIAVVVCILVTPLHRGRERRNIVSIVFWPDHRGMGDGRLRGRRCGFEGCRREPIKDGVAPNSRCSSIVSGVDCQMLPKLGRTTYDTGRRTFEATVKRIVFEFSRRHVVVPRNVAIVLLTVSLLLFGREETGGRAMRVSRI